MFLVAGEAVSPVPWASFPPESQCPCASLRKCSGFINVSSLFPLPYMSTHPKGLCLSPLIPSSGLGSFQTGQCEAPPGHCWGSGFPPCQQEESGPGAPVRTTAEQPHPKGRLGPSPVSSAPGPAAPRLSVSFSRRDLPLSGLPFLGGGSSS